MGKEEKKISGEILFNGRVITLHNDQVLCPNGAIASREYVTHNGGVCLLMEIDGKIALVKQFRYAFNEELLELPAGKLEKGENPYQAGLRELEEETGYKAESLESYGCMYPSVGYTNEIIYLYVAKNCVKTQTHFDFDEDLDLVFVEKEELKKMIKDNSIKDSKTIILLSRYLYNI